MRFWWEGAWEVGGSSLSSKVKAVLNQGLARLGGSPPGVGKVIVTVSHTSP